MTNEAFETSLITLVHEGDIKTLKTSLLSTSDPLFYLNRTYEKPCEQKCTLLMLACLNNHKDMIKMLVKTFHPDFEVLNDIRLSVQDQNPKVYEKVTVLWAVAALNNFELVKLFVSHGAHVNHMTKTCSTPLRCACFHGNLPMTRYLIAHGADVNITKEPKDTNLILSVFRQHTELVRYLVEELHCDVNECDSDHRSPLSLAVERGSIELVKYLLSHNAQNFSSTPNHLSPIMLAAEKRSVDLVEILMSHCSLFEQIETEELLGSSYACSQYGAVDYDKFFEYLSRTIELRLKHNYPKKILDEHMHEAFEYRQECQTIEQLNELRNNSEKISIEVLLIRQRLLGKSNAKFRNLLIYQGANLINTTHYLQGIRYWMYQLEIHQTNAIHILSKQLRYYIKSFAILTHRNQLIPMQILLQILTTAMNTLKNQNTDDFDENLNNLLFIITIITQIIQNTSISDRDRRAFYQLVYTINQQQYKSQATGFSLLHLCLHEQTQSLSHSIDRICKYPCKETVRTLLTCHADPNVNDHQQNTPMHVYAFNYTIVDESVLEMLVNANAHFDYVNADNERPIDVVSSIHTRQLIEKKMKICLKCICARFIRMNHVEYDGIITKALASFVQRH